MLFKHIFYLSSLVRHHIFRPVKSMPRSTRIRDKIAKFHVLYAKKHATGSCGGGDYQISVMKLSNLPLLTLTRWVKGTSPLGPNFTHCTGLVCRFCKIKQGDVAWLWEVTLIFTRQGNINQVSTRAPAYWLTDLGKVSKQKMKIFHDFCH